MIPGPKSSGPYNQGITRLSASRASGGSQQTPIVPLLASERQSGVVLGAAALGLRVYFRNLGTDHQFSSDPLCTEPQRMRETQVVGLDLESNKLSAVSSSSDRLVIK
jgi:hypothetical protein